MNLNINTIIIFALILLYIAFYLIMRIIINKFSKLDDIYVKNHKRLSLILSLLQEKVVGISENILDIKKIKENLILDKDFIDYNNSKLKKIIKEEIKNLTSKNLVKRKEASAYLGLVGSEKGKFSLESALLTEKNYSVKVYISNALTDIHSVTSLPYMIESLLDSHKWYREKCISNILEFGYLFHEYFLKYKNTKNIEHIELLIKYSSLNFNEDTKKYLFYFLNEHKNIRENLKLYYKEKNNNGLTFYKVRYVDYDMDNLLEDVCRIIADYYYRDFSKVKYYTSTNEIIQRNVFWAMAKINSTEYFNLLMGYLKEDKHEKTIIGALTKMLVANPRFLYLIEDGFEIEKDEAIRSRMAQILSNKIEYYILKLNTKQDKRSEKILIEIIKNKKINELIGFLNVNKDIDIENRLIEIISKTIVPNGEIAKEFQIYLSDKLVKKLKMKVVEKKKEKRIHKRDTKLIHFALAFVIISFIFFPFLFIIFNWKMFSAGAYRMLLKDFVIKFNYALAYYSITINFIYTGLLILSYKNVKKQARLWEIKNISMLFRDKMLPSISIIAPAYNEEKTVVESAKSLLNLNYSDYELIIVNDGSQDETLLKLIEEFSLVRTDYNYKKNLKTEPIRGIYRNPSFPRMIVIDKSNGGKADSLNAGINVANNVYFCCIDSDSLLEPDSLLKLASLTLDESVETPALGGNVFPINGCLVDKGFITDIQVAKSNLAKFQTIEYIRAFMAGRLGWQQINSLLIISGAFGLFRKDRIVGIGGYLTEKGRYNKDTVGEDMEIVVRIKRMMHEAKLPFKVLYAFNANCWTEVPEDLKSLRSQRFRWHRGLIDILYFHKKMIFNKKYKETGLIAMPYFVLFEALGPMIEIQGYIMVVLAALLGILNRNIALLLFVSTILMGVIVSLSALLIAERENNYFKLKDIMKLLFIAIIENFGPRQLFGFWRIRGLLSIVFGQDGWGNMKRRGVRR